MTKVVQLYKPYPHQKEVHSAITRHIETKERFTEEFQKIFVVKAMRQVGKSAMAENELSRFALTFNESINAYIAPTLKLSKKTFDEILKMFKGTGLIASKNKQDLIIEFVNGSVIYFFSGEQRDNLRGFTISGLLVIDEAAFIRDDIYTECLSPWCDAKKACTLVISTPKFKTGFFYDLYLLGLGNEIETVECFDFSNHDLTLIRSNNVLEQKRKTIPSQVFKSEYLGLFLDAEGSVFGDFSLCLLDYKPSYKELYVAIDFGTGSGKDYTVMTAFNEEGEQCFMWRVNDLTPTKQVDYIVRFYQQNEKFIKGFVVEQNGIGKVYYDMLKKHIRILKSFVTDNNSKRKLVEEFQVAVEQGKVRIMKDNSIMNELSFFESTQNKKTGSISYGAPAGYHDDIVMSIMLAWFCYLKFSRGASYSFMIV